MSNITDEDVNILMSQAGLKKEIAREVLILKNGDLVESIVALETGEIDIDNLEAAREKANQLVEEQTDDFDVDTTKQENLVKYREIVDSKDVIYNQKKIEKEEKEKNGGKDEKASFSIEELYKLKRGKNTFNSIRVL